MADLVSPKLGAGNWEMSSPVRYSNVYYLEQTKGPQRLVIGPSNNHVEVLLSLARLWQQDYYLLYVLVVPRLGMREPGRYQSPGPLTFEEVSEFCNRFKPFLEGDARHHLWIGSTVKAGLLVYDRHEWICAYGDLASYIEVLQSLGFQEGEIQLPSPHSHSYNEIFDDAEDQVAEYWSWKVFPLQPDDEN